MDLALTGARRCRFPQPVRRQPSVGYLPTRRHAEQPAAPQNPA
jgi:hypothetical protein